MTVVVTIPKPAPCPICGSAPDVGPCEPWPRSAGKQPWYANCYRYTPHEHCFGVNGDSQLEVIQFWNAEVDAVRIRDGETA